MSHIHSLYRIRWFMFSLSALALVAWASPQTISSIELSSESDTLKAPFKLDTKKDEDGIPVIEYSLDKINKAQNVQNLLNGHNNVANKNCKDCEEALSKARYMTCTDKNNYLEKELSKTAQTDSLLGEMIRQDIKPNSIIKPACVEMGMNYKFGESSRVFRTCNANGALSKAFRPCISENYFKVVNNSFDLVSSCMMGHIAPGEALDEQKLDVRAIYALINVESGFHVNAMSGTGAGGIGQFTGPAITDVNRNGLDSIRISLEGSKDPRCVRLSHEMLDSMTPMRAEKSRSCDRISIEKGNPMKNMIYTYAYLKNVKQSMSRVIFNNASYEKKFKLSASDLNKVKRALMVWSHNAGPAGTWTPAKALLNSVYRNKPVTSADEFINQMQSYMQKFPASANNNVGRKKETSGYFPTITKTLNQIENNAGGGSCVN